MKIEAVNIGLGNSATDSKHIVNISEYSQYICIECYGNSYIHRKVRIAHFFQLGDQSYIVGIFFQCDYMYYDYKYKYSWFSRVPSVQFHSVHKHLLCNYIKENVDSYRKSRIGWFSELVAQIRMMDNRQD